MESDAKLPSVPSTKVPDANLNWCRQSFGQGDLVLLEKASKQIPATGLSSPAIGGKIVLDTERLEARSGINEHAPSQCRKARVIEQLRKTQKSKVGGRST
jgi:hypothetical protein